MREFGVDDGDEGGVDVGKGGRGRLGRDDGPGEDSATANDILAEEFGHDQYQITHVHLGGGEVAMGWGGRKRWWWRVKMVVGWKMR